MKEVRTISHLPSHTLTPLPHTHTSTYPHNLSHTLIVTHSTRTNASEMEASRISTEAGLLSASNEVASLTGRLTLLEEEYWGCKVGLGRGPCEGIPPAWEWEGPCM